MSCLSISGVGIGIFDGSDLESSGMDDDGWCCLVSVETRHARFPIECCRIRGWKNGEHDLHLYDGSLTGNWDFVCLNNLLGDTLWSLCLDAYHGSRA